MGNAARKQRKREGIAFEKPVSPEEAVQIFRLARDLYSGRWGH